MVLRYLTRSPPEQSEKAERLIAAVRAGEVAVLLEDVTLAEVVWVLTSFYRVPRAAVADAVARLVALDGIRMPDKTVVESALGIFGRLNVKFIDALLAAKILRAGQTEIWSFDRDFDRIRGIRRREPA
ncbi:MAG TPA: PIN domain-containing protein [Chloroflexota bacterium]|nr:PIN domain-containing protein [Chloroflexota bacterium]